MTVSIVNASGCLDALTAPDVAASLDAFVTKTITPEPREGNPPVRIAETEFGMLNSIGLQGPGLEGLLAQTLPASLRKGYGSRSRSAASRSATTPGSASASRSGQTSS